MTDHVTDLKGHLAARLASLRGQYENHRHAHAALLQRQRVAEDTMRVLEGAIGEVEAMIAAEERRLAEISKTSPAAHAGGKPPKRKRRS